LPAEGQGGYQMKAVRTDSELECPGIDAGLRARGVELVTVSDGIAEADLAAAVADADLLLMCYTPVTARVIDAAPKLRGIVKYGVGIDAIDIKAATRRGIPVVNVPEYAEETVAEGAFALMIALAKRLPGITAAVAREGWIWPEQRWLGRDISGATLGAWPDWDFAPACSDLIRMPIPPRCGRPASRRSTTCAPCLAPAISSRSIAS